MIRIVHEATSEFAAERARLLARVVLFLPGIS